MKTFIKSACAATLMLGVVSISAMAAGCSTAKAHSTAAVSAKPDIVEIAASDNNFTTLVAAVQAADLVETLQSDGPFTVFAPTNAAFDALPGGTVANLLKPENKSALQGVLTYHVVSGDVRAADLVAAIQSNNGKFSIQTVNGGTLTAKIIDGAPYLMDAKGGLAKITATDLAARNGVIHVISSVVLP